MWNPFRREGPVSIPSPKPLFDTRPDVLLVQVHGKTAIKAWEQLRADYVKTGLWPIVIGDDHDLSHLTDGWDDPFPNPTPFTAGDPEEWFTWAPKAKREWLANKLAEKGAPPLAEEEVDPAAFHGEWPEGVRPDEVYVVPVDIVTKKPKESVHIALVPVSHPSEIPLKLAFGGWNENPYPDEHAIVFRYFHEKYLVEPVCMSGDTLEMKVMRPPKTKQAALDLAEKQFIYCEDIVTQGTETIEWLAASLLNSKKWFFWWD